MCLHRLSALILLLVLASACDDDPAGVEDESGHATARLGSFVQTVTIEPARPSTGDTIVINSTVINTGSPRPATLRQCFMDLEGDLQLEQLRVFRCAATAGTWVMASGETVDNFEGPAIVLSPPGRYILRVRQLLEPSLWAEVPIIVE